MIERDGYEVREGVFSEAECDSVLSELSNEVDISRPGVRNLMGVDVVARVATDERLRRLTEDLTGYPPYPVQGNSLQQDGQG